MPQPWEPTSPGIMVLPSGRLVRGRALRRPPSGGIPTFGLYLQRRPPVTMPWDSQWILWPDFWLPKDREEAIDAIGAAYARAADDRVEVACTGGVGRTGTALACFAVLDGVPSPDAVSYVRRYYHPRAVETPWQRRFVERFPDV